MEKDGVLNIATIMAQPIAETDLADGPVAGGSPCISTQLGFWLTDVERSAIWAQRAIKAGLWNLEAVLRPNTAKMPDDSYSLIFFGGFAVVGRCWMLD